MGQDDSSFEGEQKGGKSKGFDVAKLFGPITSVNTSIGIIYMYRPRVSDFTNLRKFSETESLPRIRAFIPCITSFIATKSLKDERKPPSVGDVSQLSNAEIEVLSESYLKVISPKESNTTPERPQREPNENAASYLDRLLKHDAETHQKQLRASLDNAIKSSSSIFENVRKSSSALGSTVGAFEQLVNRPTEPRIHTPDMSHLRAMEEQYARQRRERAEELEMVRLTGQMTAESAKTLKDLAEAATTLLEQLDDRDKKADESTRNQITIAVWSVGISALLALIALVVALLAYFQDRSTIEAGDKWQTDLLDAIREGNRRQGDAEKQVQQLRDEVTNLTAKIQRATRVKSANQTNELEK